MKYDYIVVGAGISGIIAVNIILEKNYDSKILWVDKDNFKVGDLSKYMNVPANSPIKNLNKFIKELKNIHKDIPIVDTSFEKFDQEKWCNLKYLVRELYNITNYLISKPNIDTITGNLIDILHMENDIKTIITKKKK